jgi:GNAT superfamily N-acetyltransferase
VEIRPARPEDAAAVAEVHVRTWQAAYEHVFGGERLATIDNPERRARWERWLEAGERVWVAEPEGRVVGFAWIGDSRDVAAADEGELFAIYVLPEAWGSGAGAALMGAALPALRERYPTSILWVLEDNPRARRFYEREGWSLDGGRKEDTFLGVEVTEVRYRISGGGADRASGG